MMRLRSIRRPLRRFAQVDGRRRLLVVEAVAWLVLARLALAVVPFGQIGRRLGTFVAPDDARVAQSRIGTSHERSQVAEDIGWAVTRSAHCVPFRAVCLPQALAARTMLKRRGIRSALHFGAGHDGKRKLAAHAWLEAAGIEVTGYPVTDGFSEVGCFV